MRAETNHVFVDVDGTLLIWPTTPGSPRPGETPKVNQVLVDYLRTWQGRSGGTIVIWTKGGTAHAQMARELTGLNAVCVAKPDCIVDDAAADLWLKKIPILSPATFCKVAAS